jgi:hypothetical protein
MATSSHQAHSKCVTRNRLIDPNAAKLQQFLVQRSIPNAIALAADYTGPADTTLAAVPELTISNGVGFAGDYAVNASRRYKFRLVANTTCNGSSGLKLDMQGGTATFTQFCATGIAYTASAVAVVAGAAAATALVAGTAAYTAIHIEGEFLAATSGTFAPRIACNASTTAPLLLAGAVFELTEIAS